MFRLDVFDQPRFGQQRVDFAVAQHEVDISDFADPVGGTLVLGRRFEEITAGAAAKVFGFADVNHASDFVLHQVDAGRLWKRFDLGCRMAEAERYRLASDRFGRRRLVTSHGVTRRVCVRRVVTTSIEIQQRIVLFIMRHRKLPSSQS